jgi:hypothetical protein
VVSPTAASRRVEQRYCELFLRDQFPSYEAVWRDYIVPLTMRPDNVAFESDEALAKKGAGLRT